MLYCIVWLLLFVCVCVTQRGFPSSSWPGCPVFAPEAVEDFLQRLWMVWPVTRSVTLGRTWTQDLPLTELVLYHLGDRRHLVIYYVVLCCIVSYYARSYHIILYHIIVWYTIVYYIISCYNTLCYLYCAILCYSIINCVIVIVWDHRSCARWTTPRAPRPRAWWYVYIYIYIYIYIYLCIYIYIYIYI